MMEKKSISQNNIMKGYIKLFRDIEGTWIYNDSRYLKAWIDILMNVNYTKGITKINGKIMTCEAGESLLSLDSWARVFGRKNWNKEKVRRFFKRLATQHYISTIGDMGTTRLRVLESVSYEESEHETTTTPDTETARHPTPIKERRSNSTIPNKNTSKNETSKTPKKETKKTKKKVAQKKKDFDVSSCDYPEEFKNEYLKEAFSEHSKMRSEKGSKFAYKTKTGTERLLKNISKLCKSEGIGVVISAIHRATQEGWQGLFIEEYVQKLKDNEKQRDSNGTKSKTDNNTSKYANFKNRRRSN